MLGIVLLIGMVAAGSIGVLLVAGEAIGSAEQQSEQEQIEQAFIELSHSISSSTSASDVSQTMELHAGEHGAIAHHDSATYKIWTESYNEDNKSHVANGSIGTIEYEADDGTKVAYEGGGVFQETGERTQILSAPPINYDHRTNTLSFPVFGLTEDQEISSGDVTISQTNVEREPVNHVEDDHVFVEIESEYCRGWEQYFTDQSHDTSIQEPCYDAANDDGKVKVRLGYDNIEDAFSSGTAVPSEEHIGSGTGSGHPLDNVDETRFTPLDDTIDQLREDFKENASRNLDTGESNSGGEYFAEELNGSYDFQLTDDDAIVVVNDSVTTDNGGITVSNCDGGEHSLKIYAKGNFSLYDDVKPTGECEGEDVDTIQMYGTSTSTVDFHDSSSTFHGLLYVASEEFNPDDGEYQVDFSGAGGVTFRGAIVANSIYFDSAANEVEPEGIDNSEIDVIPEGYEPAPQLTYLNIAEHQIEIKND
ncbi:hypothetical protein C496_03097 [Natronorubrum tibetense GA33]|uniref:DUF7305 domain-containing protein n=1 Tax=Natronorubrum tibetense GA33 TaxID=1114856 RepID=L9W8T9_9EURY|nr:hypothetical protein [Natronorubrum tibetense]ELY45895.1 hypothetical protein C496_03097 [Natronorubrum tibetense GA33]